MFQHGFKTFAPGFIVSHLFFLALLGCGGESVDTQSPPGPDAELTPHRFQRGATNLLTSKDCTSNADCNFNQVCDLYFSEGNCKTPQNPNSLYCTDSDGGYSPFEKGTVLWSTSSDVPQTTDDICLGNRVMEAVCDFNGYAYNGKTYECPGACVNGACVACVEGALCETAGQTCSGGQCQSCITNLTPKNVFTLGRVIPVYLVATDTPAADAQKRLATFDHIMISLQGWYGEAMGSAHGFKTFAVEAAHMLQSTHTRAEWDAFGVPDCGIYYASYAELNDGGLLAAAGLLALGTPSVVYMVVGGGSYRGGCGSPWMAAVEELELDRFAHRCPNGRYDGCDRNCADSDGLSGIDPWCSDWPHSEAGYGCAPVGGFAHELGHGFGLPHGTTRSSSTGVTIMDEWWNFERGASLSAEDIADLDGSAFLAAP